MTKVSPEPIPTINNDDSLDDSPQLTEYSVKNDADRAIVANNIKEGKVVMIQLPTLGLMVDASDPERIANAYEVKSIPRNQEKVITLALDDLDAVARLVDLNQIHPLLRPFFDRNKPGYEEHKEDLGQRIGGMTIVRVPVLVSPNHKINGVALHKRIVSQDKDNRHWLQFLFFGNYNKDAQALIRESNDKVGITGLTSVNTTGEDTITDLNEALGFATQRGVTVAITDPTVKNGFDTRIESYPIIVFNLQGVTILRSENMNLDNEIVKALWPEFYSDAQLPDYLQEAPVEMLRFVLSQPEKANKILARYATLKRTPADTSFELDETLPDADD